MNDPPAQPWEHTSIRGTKGEPTAKIHWEENEGHNGPVPSAWVHGAAL